LFDFPLWPCFQRYWRKGNFLFFKKKIIMNFWIIDDIKKIIKKERIFFTLGQSDLLSILSMLCNKNPSVNLKESKKRKKKKRIIHWVFVHLLVVLEKCFPTWFHCSIYQN
jgi:hypothetical protein